MIRDLRNYLHGFVKLRVSQGSPERFFNLCRYHKICMWGVVQVKDYYEMYIRLSEVKKIRPLVYKTHVKIKIVQKKGLPFWLFQYRRRKLFFLGAFLGIFLIWNYSLYVWDIHFSGNDKWTDTVLLDYLEEQDIKPGMKKENVNCSKIAADIREEYKDVVWVSASINGSCLQIQIKENEEIRSAFVEENNPCDLVASNDGIITEMITRNGTPQVHVGDTVKKGDLLVSGRIEIKNDALEIIGYQYCQADADILANTQIAYYDSIEKKYYAKEYYEEEEYRWYVLFGKYKFFLDTKTDKSGKLFEISRQEVQLKLGNNFYLPISVGKIRTRFYRNIEKTYTVQEVQRILSEKFSIFSQELEKKGIQIRENSVKINCYENYASAQGVIYLNQSITENAETEIIEIERNEINEFSGTAN